MTLVMTEAPTVPLTETDLGLLLAMCLCYAGHLCPGTHSSKIIHPGFSEQDLRRNCPVVLERPTCRFGQAARQTQQHILAPTLKLQLLRVQCFSMSHRPRPKESVSVRCRPLNSSEHEPPGLKGAWSQFLQKGFY